MKVMSEEVNCTSAEWERAGQMIRWKKKPCWFLYNFQAVQLVQCKCC